MTKQPHRIIITIFCGIYPREESHYITKRKIQNPKPIEWSILDFGDQDLVDDTPNEKLPLLIRSAIANHKVSWILVDQGSSCDIMYEELFISFKLKMSMYSRTPGGR
jgi:hypothetical protein